MRALIVHFFRVGPDGDRAARARQANSANPGSAQAGQRASRPDHVQAMQLARILAISRYLTGAEKRAVDRARALKHRSPAAPADGLHRERGSAGQGDTPTGARYADYVVPG